MDYDLENAVMRNSVLFNNKIQQRILNARLTVGAYSLLHWLYIHTEGTGMTISLSKISDEICISRKTLSKGLKLLVDNHILDCYMNEDGQYHVEFVRVGLDDE